LCFGGVTSAAGDSTGLRGNIDAPHPQTRARAFG
jgi:hypothetical protein